MPIRALLVGLRFRRSDLLKSWRHPSLQQTKSRPTKSNGFDSFTAISGFLENAFLLRNPRVIRVINSDPPGRNLDRAKHVFHTIRFRQERHRQQLTNFAFGILNHYRSHCKARCLTSRTDHDRVHPPTLSSQKHPRATIGSREHLAREHGPHLPCALFDDGPYQAVRLHAKQGRDQKQPVVGSPFKSGHGELQRWSREQIKQGSR